VRRQPLHEMKFTQKFVAGVSSPHLTVDGRKISLRAARAHDQADRDARDHAVSLGSPGTMSGSDVVGRRHRNSFLAKAHQRASLSHGRGGGRLFGSGTGIAVSKMAT
jgi:hypothetical protein